VERVFNPHDDYSAADATAKSRPSEGEHIQAEG